MSNIKNKKNKNIRTKIKKTNINKTSNKEQFSLKKQIGKIFFLFILTVLSFGAVGSTIMVSMFLFYSYADDLPSVDELKNYHPEESIKIKDRNGVVIANLGDQIRTMVPISKMPTIFVKAVISAEDASFFQHDGLNYFGMMRAFWVNLMARRYKQGGSTITQQVVKRLLLSSKRTLKRKFQEVILARRLETKLSKEEILHIYLNEIYYGHGRYGAEEAALFFFNKHIKQINTLEAALLAGIPQSPIYNSPITHPKRSLKRIKYVLNQMYKHGFISKKELEKNLKIGLPHIYAKKRQNNLGNEFIDIIRNKIKTQNLKNVQTIVSTLDLQLQSIAQKALLRGLKKVDKRQKVTKLKHLYGKKLKKHLISLKTKYNKHSGKIIKGVVVGKYKNRLIVDLGFAQGLIVEGMQRYYPKGWKFSASKSKKRSKKHRKHHKIPTIYKGDIFRVKILSENHQNKTYPLNLQAELGPQGIVVVLDVKTRNVLAMIGGIPYKRGNFNRAIKALRQPGSAFKPFIYATAIKSNRFTAASIFEDSPEVYKKWMPKSHGYAGKITIRKALSHSINSVAIQLLRRVGIRNVISLAKAAGISTKLSKNLSLALGSSEVHPIDIINAYGIFPSGGIMKKPNFILKINEKTTLSQNATRVLPQNVAWIMTSLLKSVVTSGTATVVRKLHRPVAGKTGTTNHAKDAWFIGFTPKYICGVWIGYDDRKPLGKREEGGKTSAPVFLDIMKTFLKNKPVKDFLMVPGITMKYINPKTGKVVRQKHKTSIKEYFVTGTEPPLEDNPETDNNSENIIDDNQQPDEENSLLTQ